MKIKSLLLLIGSSTLLVACAKNYTCKCTSTVGKAEYELNATFNKKSEAESWCVGSDSAEGSNVTCALVSDKIKKKKDDDK